MNIVENFNKQHIEPKHYEANLFRHLVNRTFNGNGIEPMNWPTDRNL